MKKDKIYTFNGVEIAAIKERIDRKITEKECADRLGVPRQRVNDMIAKFVMMESKSGSYSPC